MLSVIRVSVIVRSSLEILLVTVDHERWARWTLKRAWKGLYEAVQKGTKGEGFLFDGHVDADECFPLFGTSS